MSKKPVFFFFRCRKKKKHVFQTSEWVNLKLFRGKKKNKNGREKKKNKPNLIFLNKNKGSQKILSEWLINYDWEKIKNTFSEKKKTLFRNLSVWVTPKLIPGKKKYATFDWVNTMLVHRMWLVRIVDLILWRVSVLWVLRIFYHDNRLL